MLLAAASGVLGSGSDAVRAAWLPSEAEIVHWHWHKGRYGPALTGNHSWHYFADFLHTELKRAGVTDLVRNQWTFRRWQTSHWPDDSQWSLAIDGRRVPVASFGANSGETPPAGIDLPLVRLEPGSARRLDGAIAVLRTRTDAATAAALARTDYEYQSPPVPYPWGSGTAAPAGIDSVSWRIFPQLMQARQLIDAARQRGAAGAVVVFDAGRELLAGTYTFPVPELHDMPTLLVDRTAGSGVLAAADRGERATLRLEAQVADSDAHQIVGFLPGRHYGTARDEVIQLVTHTDGPAISQDNGALGILALVRYFSRIPREERGRTLMVYLDCRHFMPGQEEHFADQDYLNRHPELRARIAAVVGMEHLGQIEYEERGERLLPSGRAGPSMIWATDDQQLIDVAIEAVRDNGLPSAAVRNIERPGIHGRDQGRWYGLASPERIGGLPAVAIMGTMGGYWATSAGIERLDPVLFRRQVATFVQITRALMEAESLPVR